MPIVTVIARAEIKNAASELYFDVMALEGTIELFMY